MPHPVFENPFEEMPSFSWWQALRDLGIALVVVVAAALIGGFILLPAVHARESTPRVRPLSASIPSPSSSAASAVPTPTPGAAE